MWSRQNKRTSAFSRLMTLAKNRSQPGLREQPMSLKNLSSSGKMIADTMADQQRPPWCYSLAVSWGYDLIAVSHSSAAISTQAEISDITGGKPMTFKD